MDILDSRLRLGLEKNKISKLNPLQDESLPTILSGSDCVISSPTGTGKSLAFILPILHTLLKSDSTSTETSAHSWRDNVRGIFLMPTKELVHQVGDVLRKMSFYCPNEATFWCLADCPGAMAKLNEIRPKTGCALLVTQPAALIRMAKLLVTDVKVKANQSVVIFPNLKHVVLDEADLMLTTYGYEKETQEIFTPVVWNKKTVCILPSMTSQRSQVTLASATLTQEVLELQKVALYKPVLIACVQNDEVLSEVVAACYHKITKIDAALLQGSVDRKSLVKEAYIHVERNDARDFLVLLGLMKSTKLKPSKMGHRALIFTNTSDRAYKLSMFLNAFGFKSKPVAPNQPLALRLNNIQKLNQGTLDALVASDAVMDQLRMQEDSTTNETEARKPETETPKKKRKLEKDDKSLVSRGLDFTRLRTVVNFDAPQDGTTYVHRLGRLGRGDLSGQSENSYIALTFVDAVTHLAQLIEERKIEQWTATPQDYVSLQYRVEDIYKKVRVCVSVCVRV